MRCARCQQDNPDAARFCNQCGTPLAPVPAPVPELRRLTVLFCDLVGSVELASQHDPEEWHDLLAAYQAAAGRAIRRQHGHVAQHLGDGLVAYFGYPQAAEDDALRAVQAALELVKDVGAIPVPRSGARLRVRVGLHTGSTVMGQVGGGEGEYLALGDTPNIAARIQSLAPDNAVLLSPTTRTLVEARVHCAEFGDFALKGLPGTLRLHQALLMRGSDDAQALRGLSPLRGRGPELARLAQHWEASAVSGRCVLLLGEPGIGKSRLARELRSRVRQADFDAWIMRCSAHGANTPFAPLVQFLRQGMALAGAPEGSPAALAAILAAVGVRDEAVIAPMRFLLGLATPAAGEPEMSAQALRERTFASATTILRTMADRQRTLLILEDLHWADPTTLEWVGRVLAAGTPPGLCLLLLARTEFNAEWAGNPRLERLALEPFGAEHAAAVVAAMDADGILAPQAVERIVERAEGNPLFVEEFTRSALEARGEDVPLTLQEQTLARLDRLGPARQVLQYAAVIGRHFSRPQLLAASGLAEPALEDGLRRGVEAHMLRRVAGATGEVYAFRHALLRDAAYASLLRSARQASHARVAEALVADDPAAARANPELLAHHYTEAGQMQPAIVHWLAAARLALGRSACVEASAHARTALRLLGDPGENPAALALELEGRLLLAPALMAVRGVLDAEVEQAYSRARQLCERLGNGPKLLVPLWGLWAYELMRGETESALAVAGQLRQLAKASPQHPVAALAAAATTGMTLFYQGDLQGARAACAQGLGPDKLPAPGARSRGVHDPGVMCHTFHTLAAWLLGDTEAAEAEAAALRRAIPGLPPFDAAYAWCSDALLHRLAGNANGACDSALRAIAIGKEQAFPAWQTMGAMLLGWGRARQGDTVRALAGMQPSYEAWCASGARNLRPLFLGLLADAWLAHGDAARALASAEEGLAAAATGERCWDPELYRLRAEALAQLGEEGPATESARHAIAAAHRMEARGWLERGGRSLDRWLREQAGTR